jgi:hypothetical protein
MAAQAGQSQQQPARLHVVAPPHGTAAQLLGAGCSQAPAAAAAAATGGAGAAAAAPLTVHTPGRGATARRVDAASTRTPTASPLATISSRPVPQQAPLSAQQSPLLVHVASQQQLGVAAPGK